MISLAAREPRWLHKYRLLALVVLIACLGVTYQLWRDSKRNALHEMQLNFDFSVREATSRIEQRMVAYEQILHSAEGFLSHAKRMNRNEFRLFVDKLRLDQQYPGIQGLTFVQLVPAAEKEAHTAAIRRAGFPHYAIYPAGERAIYTSVVYIEPFSPMNQRAFGHDPYSQTARRLAMDQSRDLELPVITSKVMLVQENGKYVQAGFMMYQPIFRYGFPHRTTAERRASIAGWVSAPFRMNDLMDGLHGEQVTNLRIMIFDGADVASGAQMYDSTHGAATGEAGTGWFNAVQHIRVANRTWTVQVSSLPGFDARLDSRSPSIVAFAGTGISLLLTMLTMVLANGRERALQVARDMNSALIERETRYRQMFEDTTSIAFLLDPESGRIVEANLAAAEFWGYPQHHLRNMLLAEISTDAHDEIAHVLNRASERKSIRIECRHRLANGELRDVEIFSGPLSYQGRILLYSILHDISARKQAEHALEESEFRWKFALEGSGQGVWDWNVESGEVKYSLRWKNMLGYADNQIENSIGAWEQLIHPADKARVLADTNAFVEGKNPAYTGEYRMLRQDGNWNWILGRGTAITRSANGRALRAIGTHADINDRKQAELEQVHRIVDAAPDPMLLVGSDGFISFANGAAASTFGYALSDLIGMKVGALVPRVARTAHAHMVNEFISTGQPTSLNIDRSLAALRSDGSEFPAGISLNAFQMNGQTVVIVNIRDLTESKRAADMLQQSFTQLRQLSDHQEKVKENERKRIAQEIHDDLGQNLLALKMDVTSLYARTLDHHPILNRRVGIVLDNIDDTIQSVRTIMNDLRPATLGLGLFPAVEWQFKQFERMSGIACKLVMTAPDTEVALDEGQTLAVFRILQESLANVARHANASEVEIVLSQNEKTFSMTVSDNGKGIDAGDRRKGNSFGLIGIEERIELLEGECTIASSPGKGTVLSITIPLHPAHSKDMRADTAASTARLSTAH